MIDSRIMNDTLFILVREDNQAFVGAYATFEAAMRVAEVFRVKTEILPWKMEPLPVVATGGVLQPGR